VQSIENLAQAIQHLRHILAQHNDVEQFGTGEGVQGFLDVGQQVRIFSGAVVQGPIVYAEAVRPVLFPHHH